MAETYEYDVALSFASEDREYVEQVAKLLKTASVRVFYDAFEATNLWGKNLYDHFSDVFTNKARYCVLFASVHYASKAWTTHERKSAQERAMREKEEYILPVRLDDTELPGLGNSTAYVDRRRTSAEQLVEMILAKLRGPSEVLRQACVNWYEQGLDPNWLLPSSDLPERIVREPSSAIDDRLAAYLTMNLVYHGRVGDAVAWVVNRKRSLEMADALAKFASLDMRRVRYRAAALLHVMSNTAREKGMTSLRNLGVDSGFLAAVETGDFTTAMQSDTSLPPLMRSPLEKEVTRIVQTRPSHEPAD